MAGQRSGHGICAVLGRKAGARWKGTNNVISTKYFNSLLELTSEIADQQAEVVPARWIHGGRCDRTRWRGTHLWEWSLAHDFRGGLLPRRRPRGGESDPRRVSYFSGRARSRGPERKGARAMLKRCWRWRMFVPSTSPSWISNSGRNAVPIEMALSMKALGLKVIAITNPRQAATSPSRHASGKYLFEVVDLVIENCIPVGDAVMELPGLSQKMGPSSTVAGAAIINAVMIEAAACLQTRGIRVPVIASANWGPALFKDIEASLADWTPRVRLLALHAQESRLQGRAAAPEGSQPSRPDCHRA